MKAEKIITAGMVGALMFLGLCVGTVSAAPSFNCKNATIEQIGIVPSDSATNYYEVFLTCAETGQSRRYYITQATLGDAGWATILTAKSLTKNVNAYVSPSRNWNSLITDLEMLP